MPTIYEHAAHWVQAGIAVIPIRYREKAPESKLLPRDATGLHTWDPYNQALPPDTELQRWFLTGKRNYGVVTGWRNLVVIDFDDLSAYLSWCVWATRQGGYTARILSGTYQVRTARGMHVYVRTIEPEINRKLKGIDIKARHGYVLGEGSIHPSGAEYTVQVLGIPMLVTALSDVLPAGMLIQQQVAKAQPPVIPSGGRATKITGDLVSAIRGSQRIESFFPGAVKGRGKYLMTCCPFHDDKHPSFWIDTDKQICGCFSGCTDKPLDVINLYGRLYGIDNREAILSLARLLQ